MFATLVFCIVMSLFAVGCVVKPHSDARRGDVLKTWLVMFSSCCIVSFPVHWAFVALFW